MRKKIIDIINKIRGTDFDFLPKIYEDLVVVNTKNQRDKYKRILHEDLPPVDLVRKISRIFNISESFAYAIRGVLKPSRVMLDIIAKNPLKEYNLIPTLSLLPIYIGKEAFVIPIYNDALLAYISNNDEAKIKKVMPSISIPKKQDIVIYPDTGSRMSVTKTMPNILAVILAAFGDDTDIEKVKNMLAENKIYIINCVALNKQTLMYYPSERIEYEKESIYDFGAPRCLFLLSAGLENIESSVFIRTALSIRHSTSEGNKKTLIETPLSVQEISKLYGLGNSGYVVV